MDGKNPIHPPNLILLRAARDSRRPEPFNKLPVPRPQLPGEVEVETGRPFKKRKRKIVNMVRRNDPPVLASAAQHSQRNNVVDVGFDKY